METLIVVVVVLAVLGLVALIVQWASRPPRSESHWDRGDVDDDYEAWETD
ncbi:hypothetical protein [Nocardia vinacea]|nr:hypothetical protein [Nocardia vinacea]